MANNKRKGTKRTTPLDAREEVTVVKKRATTGGQEKERRQAKRKKTSTGNRGHGNNGTCEV